MCGIVGYVGGKDASQVLLQGLKKLEYRGYDSAGVVLLDEGELQIRRSVGKLDELENLLTKQPVRGRLGVGHTRWATHGVPSITNAHPHMDFSGQIAVVHNGIIENYAELKEEIEEEGITFQSQTDTEVVAHLLGIRWRARLLANGATAQDLFVQAVLDTLQKIRGTYALGIVCSRFPDLMIGARRDCPLVVGIGKNETFIASDVPAMLAHTRDVIFLEDGDVAILDGNGPVILNGRDGKAVRNTTKISWDPLQAEKGDYKHFMIKEINEQPAVIRDTLAGRWHEGKVGWGDSVLSEREAKSISRIYLIACGTSWHAGLIGAYWIEKLTGLSCEASIASEFRYRNLPVDERTLVVAISQSGETADTLAAIRLAKAKGAKVISIANVVGSTLTRESHASLMTHCGPEIGVASTKAFMGQLVVLNLLSLYLAQLRGMITAEQLKTMGGQLHEMPHVIEKILKIEPQIKAIAKKYYDQPSFLFLGRNVNYPIALEGALKLKEISYVHAEGYPAGEMKHGPIALLKEKMPVVAIATQSTIYEKMVSNVEEARSRRASVIAIATEGDKLVKQKADDVVYVPSVPEFLTPLANVVPLQMLAYHVAVLRGCDVDKPRNLAKSVTVE